MFERTITLCLAAASALFLQAAPVLARVVDQIVVAIDGDPYTLSNLKEYARTKMGRDFPAGELSPLTKEDKELLEQFITEKLVASEVKRLRIKVSDADLDKYITQIKERSGLSDEDLLESLRREGLTVEKYREMVRGEIEKGEIINSQVRKRVNITSEDVDRYYRLNSKKFLTQERIRLRHILFSLPAGAPPEQEKEVQAKTMEVLRRALAGENFSDLARKYSEGGGASEGGEIGWINRGSLLSEIEEVAFQRLAVGEISKPVRSSMGLHIIKLEGKDPARPLPLSDVAGKIKEELYAKALEERFQKWLKTDLRKRHRVDVKLPGVVFRPEDTKEGTVDSLMASGSRRHSEERSFLSYLNPFSYIFNETPLEGEEGQGGLGGQNIISLFGVPLFKTDSADDMPGSEELLTQSGGGSGSPQGSEDSGGFFSSILKSLNPFSSPP